MLVTGYWIDHKWNLKSIILELARLRTPHTERAPKDFLRVVIADQESDKWKQAATTDNAPDMIGGVSLQQKHLNSKHPFVYPMDQVSNFCFAHVFIFKLAALDVISTVKRRVKKVRIFLATILPSVKISDLFEAVRAKAHFQC